MKQGFKSLSCNYTKWNCSGETYCNNNIIERKRLNATTELCPYLNIILSTRIG